MSGTLPTIRGGVQCLYPVTRTVQFLTDVATALNASEARFKRRPPLTLLNLQYSGMDATDTAAMKAFFESQKGQFDSTWSVTIGATTYSAMTFLDDAFTVRETAGSPMRYSFTLRARQTKNPGQTAGSPGGAFPTLSSGLRAQLPYVQSRVFAVLVNDNPIGPRYTYTWYAGGLSGFPTRSLRGWELSYPVLTDADLSTIETHFRNQWGMWGGPWSFTDPDDGTAYANCRYADDALVITHQQKNISSLTLRIMETN